MPSTLGDATGTGQYGVNHNRCPIAVANEIDKLVSGHSTHADHAAVEVYLELNHRQATHSGLRSFAIGMVWLAAGECEKRGVDDRKNNNDENKANGKHDAHVVMSDAAARLVRLENWSSPRCRAPKCGVFVGLVVIV